MKKINKGVMTRKGYKNKKRVDTVLKEVKRTAVLIFIGFMLGLLYSNKLIYSDLIVKAQSNENKVKMKINQEEQKLLESQENVELESVEKIEELSSECTLDEVSCKIKEVADSYEVDWRLAVAISKHETGVYTSVAFKEMNNVGGNFKNGSLMTFGSLDEGIDFFVGNLKRGYIDMGLTTIESIQPKYAPIGATNDPSNLNSHWVSGVYKYFNELEVK